MSCWMCVRGIRLGAEQLFGVTGKERIVIKTDCQMGPSCILKQRSCCNSLKSFLLLDSMVWTIGYPGSHLFHFLLNLLSKLKQIWILQWNWDTQMQCNQLAFRQTLCYFPYLQIEKADWKLQQINLNISVYKSQKNIFFFIYSFIEVQAKYSTMKNWLVTAVKYKIFQTRKACINTWHMLLSVQTSVGPRRTKSSQPQI